MPAVKPKTVDEYINAAPVEAQEKLMEIRSILKQGCSKSNRSLKMGIACIGRKTDPFCLYRF
jgi:hypothetical protein